jgi:hypothetical protein
MAANTGPDINTYAIPEVALGDTFNTWRDVTNTEIYKLNKMRVYDGVSSSSIDITVAAGGTLSAAIADNVNKGVTFIQPVTFQSGVTFNGDVTFNASTFTVNANVVTIDDYNLILGNTAAGSTDTKIDAAGGGGLLIDRGSSGNTAEWLWKTTNLHGLTGVWQANAHIGISGASFGIYPNAGGILPVHGSGIRLDGGSTSDHGLLVELTSSGVAGTTSNRSIQFERYSSDGATVFMEVLSGTTYGARPFVNISDGANRKTINQVNTFIFGTPVRLNQTNGLYETAVASDADSAEVVGIVSKSGSPQFEITFIGEIFGDFAPVNQAATSLVAGKAYYLSPSSAGTITPVQPSSPGTIQKAVLIATGTNSAIVIPFTGGVLQTPIQIANSSSVATRIQQFNKFSVGDVVRFKAYTPGVTLTYSLSGGNTAEAYYPNGIYVKGQANTPEEAEIAGMVISVGVTGDVNENFDVLMDGFFSCNLSPLTAGTVYFLAKDCAGTTGSFESGVFSLSSSPPSTEGTVRKPMLMATGPLTGYLFSYRGDVRGAATGISYANLDNFLITNILDGITGDLQVGVYDSTSNGREAIRIASGPGSYSSTVGITGYVGVAAGGASSKWLGVDNSAAGNRILCPLDVLGEVRVGATLAPTAQGRDLLVSRYTSDTSPSVAGGGYTAASWNVISTRPSTPSLAIGYGVRSAVSSDGWISSVPALSSPRSALVVGVSGSDPSLVWKTSRAVSPSLDGSVSLTDTFSIVGNTAAFVGAVNIGTTQDRASMQTHKPRLFIQGDSNTTARPQVHMTTTDGNFLLMNASGRAGDYNSINQYDGGSYLVFGKDSGGGAGHTFAISPWGVGVTATGMLMSYNGTSVNVGINTYTPDVALDVNGAIKNKNPRFFVGTNASDIVAIRQVNYTTLTFQNTAVNDQYNGADVYNKTNGVFTAPVTGRYVFFGQILFAHAAGQWNSTTTGGGGWYFAKNYGTASAAAIGTTNPTPNGTSVDLVHILVSSTVIADLTAGDTVRMVYYGKPFNENHNTFGGYLIG